jgi:hypothetical protein
VSDSEYSKNMPPPMTPPKKKLPTSPRNQIAIARTLPPIGRLTRANSPQRSTGPRYMNMRPFYQLQVVQTGAVA